MPWRLMLLCGGTLALFGVAAPASAGDTNFERGFERELGRILAHEAVNAGKAVLFQGLVHPYSHTTHVNHRTTYRYYDYDDRRRYKKHRKHQRVHRRHHRRDYRHGFQRQVRHGYYYDDDYGHRKHRKSKHKKHRRHHRHDDDCDDRY